MTQTEYTPQGSEYFEAMSSVRLAKNLLWLGIFVAIAAQIAFFCLLQFGTKLDGYLPATAKACSGPAAFTCPASMPTTGSSAGCPLAQCHLADKLPLVLPVTKFLGAICALLLAASLFLGALMPLAGQLGGAGKLTSAFFWSLILLALVTPWQQIFPYSGLVGSLSNLQEMWPRVQQVKASGAAAALSQATVLYYARYLGYPGVALLVWLIVGVKFAKGYCRMRKAALSVETGAN